MKGKEFNDNALPKSQISLCDELAPDCEKEVVIREVIVQGLRLQNTKIDRAGFFREQLFEFCDQESIEQIIQTSSIFFKIPLETLDCIADRIISSAEKKLSNLEKVDMVTYYSYLGMVCLKLLYLYGATDLELTTKNDEFSPETIHLLILCLGAGYGMNDAKHALEVAIMAYRAGVKRRLITISLTKGGLYPFVQKTEWFFGAYITKTAFEKLFLDHAFHSGSLSFQSCCKRLQAILRYKK